MIYLITFRVNMIFIKTQSYVSKYLNILIHKLPIEEIFPNIHIVTSKISR